MLPGIEKLSEGLERWFSQLRALAALPEDQGSILGTYMAAHNYLEHQFWGIW